MGIYGRQLVSVKVAKLQVATMSVVRTKEAEDNEIEHLRHDLRQVQVRAPELMCICIYIIYIKEIVISTSHLFQVSKHIICI